jgi:Ni/Fe-hydrogenase subunit HybB-like protein/Fe-S-cluster-containing dehydrogenase component
MSITRRTALKTMAAAATSLVPRSLRAETTPTPLEDSKAILYDATRCIGCRQCAVACAEENGWDPALALSDDPELTYSALTVVRRFWLDGKERFRKVQCMHCLEPACVSACMLGAMSKDEDGAITWNGDLCVGCRYCEISCPFNTPRFEWDTPRPHLAKCQMCPERRAQGLQPACVEACRRGALSYGDRDELLIEARRRMAEHPELYNPKIYGEHDGGGTSVLYLAQAGVSFSDLKLPDLGEESVATLPESIQHALYRGFAAPLALLGILGALVRRSTRRLHEEEEATHPTEESAPVGGPLLTSPFLLLAALVVVGVIAVLWRFTAGLGATTNLNDGYPMGLWIAFDVVTGTALACGGYAVALLVYVANRGRYHPLVRAALVTSAFGYTLGGLSVLIDIGRAWNFYKIPLFFWKWNFNSILLEVALCIMLYTLVLWIEVSPVVLAGWRESRVSGLRKIAMVLSPRVERAMPVFIAVGLLLPTMHQSSLGSLMLMAGHKLHPLWHTPLLPLLFLVSCVAMGYGVVTLESILSARVFRRPLETPMLRGLAVPVSVVIFAYVALRIGDLWHRGRLGLITHSDGYGLLFLGEMALFLIPALGLLLHRRTARARYLLGMAVVVVFAGALYRFSTYLFAFDPGPEWSYFPAVPEFAVTFGIVASEILGYLILVKRFPILRGVSEKPEPPSAPATVPAPASAPGVTSPQLVMSFQGVDARRGHATRLATVLATALGLAMTSVTLAGTGVVRHGADGHQLRDTLPPGDRRCLTRRAQDCLDEPVPVDEPHGAVCAVCHDLWERQGLAQTVRACSGGECHSEPASITPFHGTLAPSLLSDCVHCHVPHSFRVPGNGDQCLACHGAGGEPVSWAGGQPIQGPSHSLAFRHETHTSVACTACHGSQAGHGTLTVMALSGCRACHHRAPLVANCTRCHDIDDVRATSFTVTKTLNIHVGSLDGPTRTLLFEHRFHWNTDCGVCHTGQDDLSTAEGADCSGCHAQHHDPDADCSRCHDAPAPGAHTRQAHLGCAGAGCHENAPEAIRGAPRERPLCLVCHRDRVDHMPGRNCADCHMMPPGGTR